MACQGNRKEETHREESQPACDADRVRLGVGAGSSDLPRKGAEEPSPDEPSPDQRDQDDEGEMVEPSHFDERTSFAHLRSERIPRR